MRRNCSEIATGALKKLRETIEEQQRDREDWSEELLQELPER